jgi:hypothetical protein
MKTEKLVAIREVLKDKHRRCVLCGKVDGGLCKAVAEVLADGRKDREWYKIKVVKFIEKKLWKRYCEEYPYSYNKDTGLWDVINSPCVNLFNYKVIGTYWDFGHKSSEYRENPELFYTVRIAFMDRWIDDINTKKKK